MITVNARYLGRPTTGVERVATEVVRRLDDVKLAQPPPTLASGVLGHAWEQCVLPLRHPDGWLWSPCNFGPVLRPRHIVTVHDAVLLDRPEWFQGAYARIAGSLLRGLLRHADEVITVSESVAKRLVAHEPSVSSRLQVIPLASALYDTVSTLPGSAWGPRLAAAPFLVHVASADPRKNLTTVLEAWSRVDVPAALLVLVGAPSTAAHFVGSGRFRAQQNPTVLAVGRVSDAELAWLFDHARALVAMSHYEGFDLPATEARSRGCPLLLSDIPVHREFHSEAATFVRSEDVDGLTTRLRDFLRAPRGAVTPLVPRTWGDVAADYADRFRKMTG